MARHPFVRLRAGDAVCLASRVGAFLCVLLLARCVLTLLVHVRGERDLCELARAHACAWVCTLAPLSSHSVHVCALLMQGVQADTARVHMLCVTCCLPHVVRDLLHSLILVVLNHVF